MDSGSSRSPVAVIEGGDATPGRLFAPGMPLRQSAFQAYQSGAILPSKRVTVMSSLYECKTEQVTESRVCVVYSESAA
jgi:hypothetical protein